MSLMLSQSHRVKWALIGSALLGNICGAAELSGSLSEDDIHYAGSVIGLGAAHRAWTAPALERTGLGLDLGIETTFVFRSDLPQLGNGNAVLPRIIPVPRIWLAWDLPADFQVSASFSPGAIYAGITAIGLGAQWTPYRNAKAHVNISGIITYTYISAFSDLSSHTTGLAGQLSRDLDVWQPYLGVGFLVSNTTVRAGLAAAGVSGGPYTLPVPHVYVGINLNLVGRFGFQLDLTGSHLSGAVLIATSF